MKARMSGIIARLTFDEYEHFAFAREQAASCYLNIPIHIALQVANEDNEYEAMAAITKSEFQVSERVGFKAESIQGRGLIA